MFGSLEENTGLLGVFGIVEEFRHKHAENLCSVIFFPGRSKENLCNNIETFQCAFHPLNYLNFIVIVVLEF